MRFFIGAHFFVFGGNMITLLETLWYSYEMEKPVEQTEERQRLFERLMASEEAIQAGFTKEQIEILKQFRDCTDALARLDEYDAFAKGVRFATQYLLEAMGKQ